MRSDKITSIGNANINYAAFNPNAVGIHDINTLNFINNNRDTSETSYSPIKYHQNVMQNQIQNDNNAKKISDSDNIDDYYLPRTAITLVGNKIRRGKKSLSYVD